MGRARQTYRAVAVARGLRTANEAGMAAFARLAPPSQHSGDTDAEREREALAVLAAHGSAVQHLQAGLPLALEEALAEYSASGFDLYEEIDDAFELLEAEIIRALVPVATAALDKTRRRAYLTLLKMDPPPIADNTALTRELQQTLRASITVSQLLAADAHRRAFTAARLALGRELDNAVTAADAKKVLERMRVAVGINRNLTVIAEIETLSHLSWEKPLRGWLKEMVEGKKVNLAQLWGLVRRALQEPTPHRV